MDEVTRRRCGRVASGLLNTMGEQQKDERSEDQHGEDQHGEGQVSEVQRLGEGGADTQISPDDATAGYPDGESGEPDTRGAGPDAAPPENQSDNDMKPAGHRRLGEGIDRG